MANNFFEIEKMGKTCRIRLIRIKDLSQIPGTGAGQDPELLLVGRAMLVAPGLVPPALGVLRRDFVAVAVESGN